MIDIRRAEERGQSRLSWLDSRHTFSFADYYDPAHMGFRSLRVINDDRIAPGGGFDTHAHRDMEIITYVLDGAVEHKDSLGNGSTIRPNEAQRMSAGTGIRHSEHNGSRSHPLHLLQIWILPERPGLAPGYEQRPFAPEGLEGKLRRIATRGGQDGAVTVHQDLDLYATRLATGEVVEHTLRPGRHAWVQMARGSATLNGQRLGEGDGAAVSDESRLVLEGVQDAEVLLFDLA